MPRNLVLFVVHPLRQYSIKKPAQAGFFIFHGKEQAKGLRVGFEGLRLQAQPRPAECRRIPPSPPVFNTRARASGLFIFTREQGENWFASCRTAATLFFLD
jgi:hypothetical protein